MPPLAVSPQTLYWTGIGAAAVLFLLFAVYVVSRFYIARTDRTYMTHDEKGFKRALEGWGVVWGILESVVKGPNAPKIEFVAIDPATGLRRANYLLDPRTGSINLRPQYCVPLPFLATTADMHRLLVEARVQFSLNRDLMKYVYQLDDFGLALETRIHSAFRAEIGLRQDEVLRATLSEVEAKVIERLRQQERDGDEIGEAGMALGVNFHTASFTYTNADEHAETFALTVPQTQQAAGEGGAAGTPLQAARAVARTQGPLALRPQQLDLLADIFKGRDPAATQALLAMLEMQTRQNIAEALANSGNLVVVTTQEIGLANAEAHLAAAAAARSAQSPGAPAVAGPTGATVTPARHS
jgi:hypothetical protein